MRSLELLRTYLRDSSSVDPAQLGHPFVTISRQSCAGGHRLARELVSQLEQLPAQGWNEQWSICDQSTCAALAADPTVAAMLSSKVEGLERERLGNARSSPTGRPLSEEQFKRIEAVIQALGRLGRVVIIGRGAMCVTAREPWGIHVRLVAELADRIRHLQTIKGLSEEAARAWIADQDAAHRHFVKEAYGHDIDDPLLYDLVFNTSRVEIEQVARTVIGLLTDRMQSRDRSASNEAAPHHVLERARTP